MRLYLMLIKGKLIRTSLEFQSSVAASDVSGVSSRMSSTGSKQRCEGLKRDGTRCKRLTSSGRCSTHQKT